MDNQLNLERTISLAGSWAFDLDPENKGIDDAWFEGALSDTINLPGTTDESRKGPENPTRETKSLTRVHPYVGPAFYQKEVDIPENWQGKNILFRIERTKHSTIWVNEKLIGERDSLTTSHSYDLSDYLSTGKHRLTLRIDNSNLPPVGDGHQLSDHTQTNWNGLLGKIELQARDSCFIEDIQAYPDVNREQIKLKLQFNAVSSGNLKVSAETENSTEPHQVEKVLDDFTTDEKGLGEVILNLGDGMPCWDEFNPTLYKLDIKFQNQESCDFRKLKVGMRDFSAKNGQFLINGNPTFLRGKHDACVFPLTGYAPMDKAEWKRVLTIAKSYGINHYRFHSWCPPRAAFEAADEVGIYMQPELPLWEFLGECNVDPMGDVEFRGSGDESVMEKRIRYLLAEGIRIMKAFGNHPSFCMFALGNELGGDLDLMASLISRFRSEDPRHLYAHGSNNFIFEPKNGPEDDYWTTMMTGGNYRSGDFKPNSKGKEVRASFCVHNHGHLNNQYPGTTTDYSTAIKDIDIPVVGHEVGQYQVFPDFKEIEKYTGVLQARNFEVFREELDKAGMLHLADDFFNASGALSVLCYREDIEAALRTPGFGGFQLLDLQDFPGQGTALVGVLDAFMESKGLISPEKWREFCNDVVLLVKMEKYTWTTSEIFSAELCVANYANRSLSSKRISWSLTDTSGEEIASGETDTTDIEQGFSTYGTIGIDLSHITPPQKMELTFTLEGTDYRNSYPIWIYGEKQKAERSLRISQILDDETIRQLEDGEKILFLPDNDSVKKAVPGAFQTDFWCYPMFKKYDPPGTMGILCDPNHPALSEFPTEFHSNWQWWPMLKNGCAVILDDLPKDLQPIVRVIDNFERNHSLGVLFECKVGKGVLLICSCNLLEQQDYPEARQLLASLENYMKSDDFNPTAEIPVEVLRKLFS